jgi:hypothetical protein
LVTRYPGSFIAQYSYTEFDEVMFPVGKGIDAKFDKTLRVEAKSPASAMSRPPTAGRAVA